MRIHRRLLLALALAAGAFQPSPASARRREDLTWPSPERLPLWPGEPPGGPGATNAALPELHVFRPTAPDGSALLVLPGGGYETVSVFNEGLDAARRFAAMGVTVFVLPYRLPAEGWAHLAPLQDAQRAVRLIRARAGEFGVAPERLGLLGFSSGGHLAADLGVSFDEAAYAPADAIDAASARPAFLGLVYPVTSLRPRGKARSGHNLFGGEAPAELLDARSPVLRVKPETPPSFVVHAIDDPIAPVENSLDWIAACRAVGVSVEAHLLAAGGHGFGMSLPQDNPGSRWPELFAEWMP